MKKLLFISAATLVLAACGTKDDAVIAPSETAYDAPSTTVADDDVDLIELPNAQAAMIAAAGSDTIYFATDQYNLEMDARATLEAQARWLIDNPTVNASIEGHADERGTREYNLALGERRANAARDYLASMGVPNNRLTVVSWGKERPVALGSNEQAWAQNRRAVTVIVR
ncbi:peptidoglycan-associated lipoprotein Pal [Sphingomicrobium astaxanthinifaciens]|uniref:peptidoglycan-associated lipoprotein Pal n=1 Tax=Sphingomicrobium astaxanthinifaciens TaxID=1227949 RepID=UPI001FCB9333|nr:peptidoglycan-associated lipoprotein Pal [Sphingomicrobium astaxanthinifaciens]MCJ7420899.1 peptidoglycan-associated lipoprotein Pal [Sphingomicrobium astaxanthinifaciens]